MQSEQADRGAEEVPAAAQVEGSAVESAAVIPAAVNVRLKPVGVASQSMAEVKLVISMPGLIVLREEIIVSFREVQLTQNIDHVKSC